MDLEEAKRERAKILAKTAAKLTCKESLVLAMVWANEAQNLLDDGSPEVAACKTSATAALEALFKFYKAARAL